MIKINNKPALPSVCEACQLGKSKCLPFDLSVNRSAEPSELIHCDLWPLLLLCLGLTINTMWVLLLTTVPGSYGAIHWRIKQIFLCIYSVWENGVYSIRKAYKGVSFWWWRREFKSEKLKRHFQNSGVSPTSRCGWKKTSIHSWDWSYNVISLQNATQILEWELPDYSFLAQQIAIESANK